MYHPGVEKAGTAKALPFAVCGLVVALYILPHIGTLPSRGLPTAETEATRRYLGDFTVIGPSLWDDTKGGGASVFEEGLAPFYPGQMVNLLAGSFEDGLLLGFMVHGIIAASGMILILESLGVSARGRTLAAISYALAPRLVEEFLAGSYTEFYLDAWIPWAFLGAELISKGRGKRGVATVGISLGFGMLASSTSLAVFLAVLLFVYLLVSEPNRRGTGMLGLGLLLALGISSPGWIPRVMERAGMAAAGLGAAGAPRIHAPARIIHLAEFFVSTTYWRNILPTPGAACFIGAAAFIPTIYAVSFRKGPQRRRTFLILSIISVAAPFTAELLGIPAPRGLFAPFLFSASALAGMGLDRFSSIGRGRWDRILSGLAAAALALSPGWWFVVRKIIEVRFSTQPPDLSILMTSEVSSSIFKTIFLFLAAATGAFLFKGKNRPGWAAGWLIGLLVIGRLIAGWGLPVSESGEEIPSEEGAPVLVRYDDGTTIEAAERAITRVTDGFMIRISPRDSGDLIVRRNWSPFWTALIEGRREDTRPFGAYWSVRLRPGDRLAILRYSVPGLANLLLLGAASLLLAAYLIVSSSRTGG